MGIPNFSAYCTSKFAVRGFTESLMVEFHKSPISIHCVLPGGIDTAIADNSPNAEEFKKVLTTPPEDIVKYVIKCIKQKKSLILYGNDASTLNFVSKFIPVKMRIKYTWKRMIQMGTAKEYVSFNSLMNSK